jgi:hypothetical protein
MTILVLSRRHPFAGTSRSRHRTRFIPAPANAARASPNAVGPLRVLTMMQSYASAANSGRWAHSLRRHLSHVMLRVHTTSDCQSAVRLKPAVSAEGKKMFLSAGGLSACRAQDHTLQ